MTTIIRSPLLFGSALVLVAALAAASMSAQSAKAKQAIAHRGASAYAPEHTAAAYKLAMDQKVDFVEPDLAVSKDNVLFCMHDDTLERTLPAVGGGDISVADMIARSGARHENNHLNDIEAALDA